MFCQLTVAAKSSVSWCDVNTKEFETAHLLTLETPVLVFPVLLLPSTNSLVLSTLRDVLDVVTHG